MLTWFVGGLRWTIFYLALFRFTFATLGSFWFCINALRALWLTIFRAFTLLTVHALVPFILALLVLFCAPAFPLLLGVCVGLYRCTWSVLIRHVFLLRHWFHIILDYLELHRASSRVGILILRIIPSSMRLFLCCLLEFNVLSGQLRRFSYFYFRFTDEAVIRLQLPFLFSVDLVCTWDLCRSSTFLLVLHAHPFNLHVRFFGL